jgi:serine/threonine-protein kinase
VSQIETHEEQEHRDQLLAGVLAELTEQRRLGKRPDLESAVKAHPELAAELRELWGVVQLAGEFGLPAGDDAKAREMATLLPSPARQSTPSCPTLPRRIGNYELLEELGRGGMGIVYKARQLNPERIVALKMILRGELASETDVARFRSEAQSAARFDGHPDIISVHEVNEHEGQPYFSMEYVEGTALNKLVASGPLPPREAARYVAAVARAVHYAHEKGILHRDLKPSNILIDEHGRPHVMDFGLAKRVKAGDSLTQTGAIVGTPSYMAPEQAAGSRGVLSPASDVYSLGAVLYDLLTGRPPFQAATPVDTIMLVLEQDVVPPRALNPKVDRQLEMICLKCLQKPPELRYQTAAHLAGDLEAYLQGEPISARPLSIIYFLSRMLSETHHAAVLENWGLLWMWHSLVLFVLCAATNVLSLIGETRVLPYLALWMCGLGTWASVFWGLRRRAGPITFVERQIAHVWASGTIASIGLFFVELLLKRPVLSLSPVLAVFAGMNFLVKAGTLSGYFYIASALCFVTAVVMAMVPAYGLFLFGFVSALCFFIPGAKYYRQRVRTSAAKTPHPENHGNTN